LPVAVALTDIREVDVQRVTARRTFLVIGASVVVIGVVAALACGNGCVDISPRSPSY
jgi:hypothetical protein